MGGCVGVCVCVCVTHTGGSPPARLRITHVHRRFPVSPPAPPAHLPRGEMGNLLCTSCALVDHICAPPVPRSAFGAFRTAPWLLSGDPKNLSSAWVYDIQATRLLAARSGEPSQRGHLAGRSVALLLLLLLLLLGLLLLLLLLLLLIKIMKIIAGDDDDGSSSGHQ